MEKWAPPRTPDAPPTGRGSCRSRALSRKRARCRSSAEQLVDLVLTEFRLGPQLHRRVGSRRLRHQRRQHGLDTLQLLDRPMNALAGEVLEGTCLENGIDLL